MVKKIIKEIIITILLIIVIGLGLAIILYDYMPSGKIVPATAVAYEMPNEIKNEITVSDVMATENVVRTYSISAKDLDVYEYTNNYDKGKENPFAIGDCDGASTTPGSSETNSASGASRSSSNNSSSEEYKGK